MPKKTFKKGRTQNKATRDDSLISKLRKECIHESEEAKTERLRRTPESRPPFYGQSERIIRGRSYGPKL